MNKPRPFYDLLGIVCIGEFILHNFMISGACGI